MRCENNAVDVRETDPAHKGARGCVKKWGKSLYTEILRLQEKKIVKKNDFLQRHIYHADQLG